MTSQEEQKPVRTLLNDLHKDLKPMIFKMCRGHEVWLDLFQESCLEAIESFGNDTFTESRFKVIFYRIAQFKLFFNRNRNSKTDFHYRFLRHQQVTTSDELILENLKQGESEGIIFKELIEASTLNELEKVLLNKYLEVNCKVSQMSRDLDVSNQALKDRIEVIKQKIKNGADNYFS